MPRLSPGELQEAKKRKAEERRLEAERLAEERKQEEAAERDAQEQREFGVARSKDLYERHTQLSSFADGIYTELSKTAAKWPEMPVSQRMLDQTNRAIRDTKKLMEDEKDAFIGDLVELVPAGEMPQARDVALVLRQVKQALDRMNKKYQRDWNLFY